jgi:hypothetical protein
MYIYFGDYVVAIEKLTRVKPSSMGLSPENPIKLVDVLDFGHGQKIERPVEGQIVRRAYGWELNDYLAHGELWATLEEHDMVEKWRKEHEGEGVP